LEPGAEGLLLSLPPPHAIPIMTKADMMRI
jgi:hypothetical protein